MTFEVFGFMIQSSRQSLQNAVITCLVAADNFTQEPLLAALRKLIALCN